MNTKTVSPKTLSVIDHYLHFQYGGASASIPYFNNNRKTIRAGLRGAIGKGSPQDIFDEIEISTTHDKITPGSSDNEAFKHFLVDNNIGIDCSGLVFYILNAETHSRGNGTIARHMHFPFCKGIAGTIRAKLRPVENAGVATFAHEKNSKAIDLKDALPGDIITLISTADKADKNTDKNKERDHILFIHQVDYQNFVPTALYYTHSIAWPTDGMYGHGVRQGKIEIIDADKPLTEQTWIEADKIGTNTGAKNGQNENYTFARALQTRTEIRRMLSL